MTPGRIKTAIPKEHPVNVYLNPNYKMASATFRQKTEGRSSVTKISDLRNPFKKWKPSQRHKQTTRALKQISHLEAAQQLAQSQAPLPGAPETRGINF